jgi:UDP-GlcNAc:undecaprenyl-phosphate/decaprenyl-phosphate GlcNAc-1-phosphate transferase
MKTIIEIIATAGTAFLFVFFLIPVMKKVAIKTGWVDKPNARKIHAVPVPLIGGVTVGIAILFTWILNNTLFQPLQHSTVLLSSGFILLVVGAIDDRFEVKPIYRLLLQFACAYAAASSGIRITTLFGLFGIHAIPEWAQYTLTIVVITGVVNAYNLMDGIDGLLGFLALAAFCILSVFGFALGHHESVLLNVSFMGALLAFLRYNLSTNKIFMGDAGSTFLGYILIVSAIQMLNFSYGANLDQSKAFAIVSGIFFIPVVDSLRVYWTRIKRGHSPFKADRNHLHHLLLTLITDHKKSAFLIASVTIVLLLVAVLLTEMISIVLALLSISILYTLLVSMLQINKGVIDWSKKIQEMEKQ